MKAENFFFFFFTCGLYIFSILRSFFFFFLVSAVIGVHHFLNFYFFFLSSITVTTYLKTRSFFNQFDDMQAQLVCISPQFRSVLL